MKIDLINWSEFANGTDESWDIYDCNRIMTGKTIRRGEPMSKDEFHLVIHVWIRNKNGDFLITKRANNKTYPNLWETPGGSAISGDDSITAAIREAYEETGLTLSPKDGKILRSYRGDFYFADVWLFETNFDLNDITLQASEVSDKRLTTIDEIDLLNEKQQFAPYIDVNIIKDYVKNHP